MAAAFPTPEAVNEALRLVMQLARIPADHEPAAGLQGESDTKVRCILADAVVTEPCHRRRNRRRATAGGGQPRLDRTLHGQDRAGDRTGVGGVK